MTIGLLLCDHVAEALRPIAGDYDAMFRNWLGPPFPDATWRIYDLAAGQYPTDLAECDFYITTGSKASVYDDEPWIYAFAGLVRDIAQARLPMVGVCFGHQMIAHALGGRTAKSDRGWGIGVHTFDVSLHQPWMQPPRERFSLLMSCQDQVQLLPPGAQVLASSPHCPVALYQAGTLLGIQGHPEWTPEYADALLEIRRERIGPALVDAARKTLSQALDNALLARWIRHWLAANC
jgi:GMP synthase-like glutamine amidotransferase